MGDVQKVSYAAQVASRLNIPGLILMILGAVLVYGSIFIAGKIKPEDTGNISLICKFVGCALALVGALMLLSY